MNTVTMQKQSRGSREPEKQKAEVPSVTNGQHFAVPDVDIFETKDAYVLLAEMPGVNKDGLEILLESDTLTIVGRRTDQAPTGNPVYREARFNGYRRVFEVDPAIDTGKITARIEQGILTLELPKAESVKPRKITVS
jgi:HSP20 family protein